MPYKKQVKSVSAKVLVISLALATILVQAGVFFSFPQTVMAADGTPPNIWHWGVSQVDGDASATTTLPIFAFSGDETASPGGSPDLMMTIFYQDDAWANWSEVSCTPLYATGNLFRCNLGITSGADARTIHYYLRSNDTINSSFLSWASDTTATT